VLEGLELRKRRWVTKMKVLVWVRRNGESGADVERGLVVRVQAQVRVQGAASLVSFVVQA
jgi:hypothetical protein